MTPVLQWVGGTAKTKTTKEYTFMHVTPYGSKREFGGYRDGIRRYDYETAHSGAGDPGYEEYLPDSCAECFKQKTRAAEEGWVPTEPDQKIPDEVVSGLA